MTDDSQLPAVREPMRLDVATREALKQADFDPRIVESVQSLSKVGVEIAPGSSSGYVLAAYYERMEGLRQARKYWMELSRDGRRELAQLRKDAKAIAKDPDQAQRHAKLERDIDKLVKDIASWDVMQRNLGDAIGQTGKEIMALEETLKKPAASSESGSMSWDPDKPAPSVNLQVNVSGGAVSVDGKAQQ